MGRPVKISTTKRKTGTVTIYESDNFKSLLADGILGMVYSGSSAKVDFYETVPAHALPQSDIPNPAPSNYEARVLTFRVTMPIRQLLEFCVHALNTLRIDEQRHLVDVGLSEEHRRALELIDMLQRSDHP